MSKEQQCKCCQDYWYTSNLTNGLCPNCYDYVSATEAQNKRVLEKLELIVRSNQELEKALENAIIPKFKKGQKVYYINSLNEISSGIIHNIRYDSAKGFDYFIPFLRIEDFRIKEEQLFETEEQAQKEIKNEVNND